MSKKYRWGTMVPLIGGSAIGCNKATETLPLFHFSFDGFRNICYPLCGFIFQVPGA